MEGCKKKYKVRTQECDSSEQALRICCIMRLHTKSYQSTAVIKIIETLPKDLTHCFITEDIHLN